MTMSELSELLQPAAKTVRVGKWEIPIRKLTLKERAMIEELLGDQTISAYDAMMGILTSGRMAQIVFYVLVRRVDANVTMDEVAEHITDDDVEKLWDCIEGFIPSWLRELVVDAKKRVRQLIAPQGGEDASTVGKP